MSVTGPYAGSADTPATALYDGQHVVLELNDGYHPLRVGSVEMTPEQARALAAELEARASEAER